MYKNIDIIKSNFNIVTAVSFYRSFFIHVLVKYKESRSAY